MTVEQLKARGTSSKLHNEAVSDIFHAGQPAKPEAWAEMDVINNFCLSYHNKSNVSCETADWAS